jgi:hypothetical protein
MLLNLLAKLTDTQPAVWEPMVGPDSRCGVDYWYRHPSGQEAYINDDQGHITISVEGEKVFEGYLPATEL